MFEKILIANRGEIACRVMRTARRLNVRTVAVHSDIDSNSQHVLQSDESVCIGKSSASESYLRGDLICQVAKDVGAQGIHPGYGFLSENAEFANLCEDMGIKFIGPPSSAITAMGSKSESKRIMLDAGVPCTPGYHGEDQSMERLKEEAVKMGFPVMLKAVMGGGGKGMRVVEELGELEANIEACQREALSSFGDGRILIEKFLRTPRHIELQIFGDSHGNAVHLFERDCSVQRRHQKVLEESPAPGMSLELRDKMGQAAVRAAKAVGYVGAGTVEFMVDDANLNPDSPFYFMEMNTRLQVEHPVTEMVTGVDLVEWQLRVASGEPLPIVDQSQLSIQGHALEARIYSESPGNNFLPGSGKIQYLKSPPKADNIRIETGVVEKDTVSVFYDPMISKLVVHSKDREMALREMNNSLNQYRIVGVPTNIEFLLACVNHHAFQKGGVDTSFLKEYESTIYSTPTSFADDAKVAALGIVSRCLMNKTPSTLNLPFGFRVNYQPYLQNQTFDIVTDDTINEPRRVQVSASQTAKNQNQFTITVSNDQDDESITMDLEYLNSEDDSVMKIILDGKSMKVVPVIDEKTNDLVLFDTGRSLSRMIYRINSVSKAFGTLDGQAGGQAKAPMPGKIIKIIAQPDEQVEKDQPLLIIEAMKMEHVIKAPNDGTVESVNVQVGDFVDDSKVLVQLV